MGTSSAGEPEGSDSGKTSLGELASLFLKLGTTAFGGPAAHIAMMRDEVVRRRKWLTDERFLDLLGATNLIPGPNSTEMAIHVGWSRRRWAGLVVAGVCFIVPAMLMTGALGCRCTPRGCSPESPRFGRQNLRDPALSVARDDHVPSALQAATSWGQLR